jgi:hypothetical protein
MDDLEDLENDPGIRLGVAASLGRLYASDQREFLDTLAGMLESALPLSATVRRRRGLFADKGVQAVSVTLGEYTYGLENLLAGTIGATRSRTVRGIKLKTEALPLEEWLALLIEGLEEHARTNERARDALKAFLGA